jgi:hypothetical protein
MAEKNGSSISPSKFVLRIARCGTDTYSIGYKTIEDEDALKLAYKAVGILTQNFVNKDLNPQFKYHLACMLLHNLKYDTKMLDKDIKEAEKILNAYKFKS